MSLILHSIHWRGGTEFNWLTEYQTKTIPNHNKNRVTSLALMKLKRISICTWSPTTFLMDISVQNQFAFQRTNLSLPFHSKIKMSTKNKSYQPLHTFQRVSLVQNEALLGPQCEPQWLQRLTPADHLRCDPSCKAALRTRRRHDRSRRPPSWHSWSLEDSVGGFFASQRPRRWLPSGNDCYTLLLKPLPSRNSEFSSLEHGNMVKFNGYVTNYQRVRCSFREMLSKFYIFTKT